MKIVLDSAEVTTIIERLAIDIFQHVPVIKDLVFIGIQSRGDKIAERLRSLLHIKMQREGIEDPLIPLGILNITFYRDDLKKKHDTPQVNQSQIDFDMTNKHVILVDDVFYTGRTVRAALDAIFEAGRPATIDMLTLISRPGRELPIFAEFIGMELDVQPDEYVKVKIKEVEGEDLVCVLKR
jgi:pyrimidine operon attenuation protein/uracil phosphoribosyltransferase